MNEIFYARFLRLKNSDSYDSQIVNLIILSNLAAVQMFPFHWIKPALEVQLFLTGNPQLWILLARVRIHFFHSLFLCFSVFDYIPFHSTSKFLPTFFLTFPLLSLFLIRFIRLPFSPLSHLHFLWLIYFHILNIVCVFFLSLFPLPFLRYFGLSAQNLALGHSSVIPGTLALHKGDPDCLLSHFSTTRLS
jgi:hypothetical protein